MIPAPIHNLRNCYCLRRNQCCWYYYLCKRLLWLLLLEQQWPSNGLITGVDCLRAKDTKVEDFCHFPPFILKLPTTQPWEKTKLSGQWWTTWKKIQKKSELIKTHLYYPKILSFFFSFCVFLSVFPFFSFLLNFLILPNLLNSQDLWTGQETFTNDGLSTRLCK